MTGRGTRRDKEGEGGRYRSLRLFVRSSILSTFLILCMRFARLAASLRDAVEVFGVPGRDSDCACAPGSVLFISIVVSVSGAA